MPLRACRGPRLLPLDTWFWIADKSAFEGDGVTVVGLSYHRSFGEGRFNTVLRYGCLVAYVRQRSSFRSRIMITSRKCVLCDWSNFDFVVKWDSNVAKWDLFTSPSRFAYLFYIKYIFMYSLYVHIVEDYSHQGKIAEEAPKCTRQVARMSAQWCSSEKLKYAKHFTVRDRESRIDLA